MPEEILSADDARVRTVADLIRNRRTTNLFEAEPVAQQAVIDAIDVARWAPNHRLTEPWRFYLLGPATTAKAIRCWADYEAELKGEAAGAARAKRLESIPGHFVVTSRRDENAVIDRENYAACCCAMQNLMLYLWQRGIGVKWTTGAITREQRLYDLLGIDAEQEEIVGYFWYGRPKAVAEQSRRDVDDIVVALD
ncbi:MAG: nitroreductase [Gammaproteobacteria bacterium]|nr:nitroreductase [Gammaproteobacteria bacterium]